MKERLTLCLGFIAMIYLVTSCGSSSSNKTPNNPTPGKTGTGNQTPDPANPSATACSIAGSGTLNAAINQDINVVLTVHVTGNGTMSYNFNATQGTIDVEGNVQSSMMQSTADDLVKKNVGVRTLYFMNAQELAALKQKDPTWANVNCSMAPVKRQVFKLQGDQFDVTYDPALPFIFAPNATADQYKKEWPTAKTFNFKGTLANASPAMQFSKGHVFTGSIAIAPTATSSKGLPGDIFFGLSVQMSSLNEILGAGLPGPEMQMGINTQQHRLSGLFDAVSISGQRVEVIFK